MDAMMWKVPDIDFLEGGGFQRWIYIWLDFVDRDFLFPMFITVKLLFIVLINKITSLIIESKHV